MIEGMELDGSTLGAWVEGELAKVPDERVTSHIRRLLVEPSIVLRLWDYGEPGQRYPCWTVLDNTPHSDTCIAYCASGLGPRCPWGLVWVGDDVDGVRGSMGMGSGWYYTFMDAFFASFAATALPIWRVFKEQPEGSMTPVTEEGEWAATWRQRDAIQAGDPASRYDVDHSIAV